MNAATAHPQDQLVRTVLVTEDTGEPKGIEVRRRLWRYTRPGTDPRAQDHYFTVVERADHGGPAATRPWGRFPSLSAVKRAIRETYGEVTP